MSGTGCSGMVGCVGTKVPARYARNTASTSRNCTGTGCAENTGSTDTSAPARISAITQA